jgi:DNA-directed RNA polymerase specialized sigma24 family protein
VNLCATIDVDVAPATHEELGMLAQGGLPSDTEAFGRLIETHRRDVVLLCYRFLGSLHETEEAAQETAPRAW